MDIASLASRALRRLGVTVVTDAEQQSLVMTTTVADLARQALQMLGVIAADETAAAADTAIAIEKIIAVHDTLNALGSVSWSTTKIPLAVANEYVTLAAIYLGPAFGKQTDPARIPVVEARVRQMAMIARSQALAEQAVMDVHANLAARGKVRWSAFDVPSYADNAYVLLAANLLAPQFALPADPLAEVRAMRELVQVISLPTSGERIVADYF